MTLFAAGTTLFAMHELLNFCALIKNAERAHRSRSLENVVVWHTSQIPQRSQSFQTKRCILEDGSICLENELGLSRPTTASCS